MPWSLEAQMMEGHGPVEGLLHAVYTGDVNEAVEGFLKYQLLKLGGAGIVLTHHNPRRHHEWVSAPLSSSFSNLS